MPYFILDTGKIKFNIVASRVIEEPPSIQVTFANGVHDDFEIEHYKMNRNSAVGCNYFGQLRNSHPSYVAVTGCLNKPGDKLDISLISGNNIDTMFSVDIFGNAEVIKGLFVAKGIHIFITEKVSDRINVFNVLANSYF